MSQSLRVRRGGEGDAVLLLLHGLGATGDVWDGLHRLLPGRWFGRWVTPDLPGHGGSAPLVAYTFEGLAEAVARVVPATNRLVVLGHSLGGVVALALAGASSGVRVAVVVGLGIKVAWSGDEVARARALAARPNPVYATRAEAAERHLKVAGLVGLMPVEDVPVEALAQTAAGWTLAFDPAAFAVGVPDMPALLGAARANLVLAAGERDPMCSAAQLRQLVPDPVLLRGLGHNAHVEDPGVMVGLLDRLAETGEPR